MGKSKMYLNFKTMADLFFRLFESEREAREKSGRGEPERNNPLLFFLLIVNMEKCSANIINNECIQINLIFILYTAFLFRANKFSQIRIKRDSKNKRMIFKTADGSWFLLTLYKFKIFKMKFTFKNDILCKK